MLRNSEIEYLKKSFEAPEIKLQRFGFVNKIILEGIIRYNTNCIFVDETRFNLHINRTQARSRRN
jgi:hypothetical protein